MFKIIPFYLCSFFLRILFFLFLKFEILNRKNFQRIKNSNKSYYIIRNEQIVIHIYLVYKYDN